jgi:hypothetical protein
MIDWPTAMGELCPLHLGQALHAPVASRSTDREEVPNPGATRGRGQRQGQAPLPGNLRTDPSTALPFTIHAVIRQALWCQPIGL